MAVRVHDAGNHGLAGEIDARGARRRRHLAAASDHDDTVTVDDESSVLDRRATVAGDESRAFEQRDVGLRADGQRIQRGGERCGQ